MFLEFSKNNGRLFIILYRILIIEKKTTFFKRAKMKKYRVICTSPADGSLNSETVTWAEADDNTPASDFCPHGHTVHTDEIVEANLPNTFPLNHTFERGL
jgi:hypothetical protein